MSSNTLPEVDLSDYEEEQEGKLEVIIEEEEPEEEETAPEEEEPAPAPAPSEEELFELPEVAEPIKPKKKKRQLSQKQLDNLKKAREKAAIRRKELKAIRDKEKALDLAEKKKHIRERKARKLKQTALLEVDAEEEIMKQEKDMWNEDKLVHLINRTMDSYHSKRQKEKLSRQQIPISNEQYQAFQQQPPQPQRAIPRQPAAPRKARNPYSQFFGLTAEDEDYYNL